MAASLAAEILSMGEKRIESVSLIPSEIIGSFEIRMDNQIIFSKQQCGRLPNPGEVEQLLASHLI